MTLMAQTSSAGIGDFAQPARALPRPSFVWPVGCLVLAVALLSVWPQGRVVERLPPQATPAVEQPRAAATPLPASLTQGVYFPRLKMAAPTTPPLEIARKTLIENLRQSAELAYGNPSPPSAGADPLFVSINVTLLPLGMQNNNPGNIKFVAGQFWPGQRGPSFNTDQGDPQVVFDNAADGMFATAQLALKRFGWGHDTVRKLIADRRAGWTPGNLDGARGVAAAAGFRLDQRLDLRDPAVLSRLLRGIVTQEHGPFSRLYPDSLIEAAVARALAEG